MYCNLTSTVTRTLALTLTRNVTLNLILTLTHNVTEKEYNADNI